MDAVTMGLFIADRRKELGLTQAQLAERLHVTDKAVSRWERGVGLPDIATLEPLAAALEVSLLELMQARRIQQEQISTAEAEQILADTLSLSLAEHPGLGLLYLFGLLALLLVVLLVISGREVLLPITTLLCGLAAWAVPIWCLTFRRKKQAAPCAVVSMGCALAALLLQFRSLAHRVAIRDWSALLDTTDALCQVALLFCGVTLTLNVLMILFSKGE